MWGHGKGTWMLRNVFQSIESMDAQEISQSLAEKRRSLRIKSYAQAQVVIEGEAYRAVIIELSLEGLRIKSMEAPLVEGAVIEVVYHPDPSNPTWGSVKAQVAWVKRSGRELIAGMRYSDSSENLKRSWVKYLLQEIGFDENRTFQRRQHIRVDASIPARLLADDQSLGAEGRLVNIGIGGTLLESRQQLTRGSLFTVEMSLWRILPTLRLPVAVLDSRAEGEDQFLTSLKFGAIEPDRVKLLGNYIINMINQSSS